MTSEETKMLIKEIKKKFEPSLKKLQKNIIISPLKNKKYRLVIDSDNYIDFGSQEHEHYKDNTLDKKYLSKNHNDDKRREMYYKRHSKNIKKALDDNKLTASILSSYFLW